MSDDSTQEKKSKLTLSSSTLTLSRVGGGGRKVGSRSKTVTVEVKKKRRSVAPDPDAKVAKNKEAAISESKKIDATGSSDDLLTKSEQETRLSVLKQAQADREREAKEEEIRKQEAIEEAKRKEEEKQKEAEEAAKQKDEASDEDENGQANESAAPKTEQKSDLVRPIKTSEKFSAPTPAANTKDKFKKAKEQEEARPKTRKDEPKRRSNKLTITQALTQRDDRMRSLASIRRAREKAKRIDQDATREKVVREVTVPEVIEVQELANRMAERLADVTRELMKMGIMATPSQTIDADTAELIIEEFGHKIRRVTDADVEDALLGETDDDAEENLIPRAPVVTIMGHVDHGKTSLLDAIRQAKVAEGEAGGITQHIGAYQVKTDSGKLVTFIDTPGHEAFTSMRSRGAQVTDVVILVVAANDGIMAQTVEAINHAKAAEVPIIVAVNKIDLPDADIDRVKNQLLEHELISEDMGGETLIVGVSAKQKLHLDDLLEAVLLQSEMLELKANPNCKAKGVVVESRLEKERGVVTTLLVQKGTLKVGDIIVAGKSFGRVRAMVSAEGAALEEAGPALPVEVLGLNESPEGGDDFGVVENEKQAREITEYRTKRDKDLKVTAAKRGSLEELFSQASDDKAKDLALIIKADTKGSIEAIEGSIAKLPDDEIKIKVLHTAVGGITSSDISLAQASSAMIVGFNVRADLAVRAEAQKENIDIRYYSVIYDLIDDVKAVLSGMLSPMVREEMLGTAEVRQIFNMSKVGKVAGTFVIDGMIKRGANVRLLRDNVVIHEGKLKTLKRFKDDVKEVGQNFECGMAFENYDDLKEGDMIEAYELIEEKREI